MYKQVEHFVSEPIKLSTDELYSLYTPLEGQILHTNVQLPSGEQTLYLREAGRDDVMTVESLIRDSALQGQGFGIDEFTEQGIFNRKLLRRTSCIVGSLHENGPVIAAVLLGPSAVCRGATQLLNFYPIVAKEYRRHGIANILLEEVELFAREVGYEGILLEVYQSDSAVLQWFSKHNYHVTASLPECGYLKGQGYTNLLLLYKDFYITSKF